jgi:hypothetical protein
MSALTESSCNKIQTIIIAKVFFHEYEDVTHLMLMVLFFYNEVQP